MFDLSVPIYLEITQLANQQNPALGLMVLAFGPDMKEWTFGGFLSNLPRPGQPAQPDSHHSILATARSLPPPPPPTPSNDTRGDHLYVVMHEESEKWRSKSFITRGSYESDDDTGMFLTDDGLAIFVRHQADFEEGESVWMIATGANPADDYVFAVPISIRAGEPQSAPDYGDGARIGMIRSRVAARLAELCDWSGNASIEQAVITAHLAPESLSSADRARALEFLAPHASATLDDYLDNQHNLFIEQIEGLKLLPPMTEGRLVQPPTARLVKTARDAEEYAAEFMVALGFADAVATPVGSDGGIDVTASGAVAQVKMEGLPTGRPAVQRIAGAASNKRVDALFFSLAGYTSQAVEWADEAGVALFEFAFDGTVEPRSRDAHRLLSRNQTAPHNWYADPLERFEYRWWDGETWTANVATRGVPQTDPMGIAVE